MSEPTPMYDSIIETLHLLRSPANAKALLEAIAAADAGEDLIEFDPTREP